jgi:hypothetical protein
MSNKRTQNVSDTEDREQRRAKRTKANGDEDFGTPRCKERYCGGIVDPCLNCKDGATRPAYYSKRKSVVAPVSPKAFPPHCVLCSSIDDLVLQPSGCKVCQKCVDHRQKVLEAQRKIAADKRREHIMETAQGRIERKANGKSCVVCDRDKHDRGKEIGEGRWICSYCDRSSKSDTKGKKLCDHLPQWMVQKFMDEMPFAATMLAFSEVYRRSSFAGKPEKLEKFIDEVVIPKARDNI